MARISERADEDEFRDENRSLWRIALAPTVWAFHFLFCYCGAAIWCAKHGGVEGITFLRLSIAALTVLALAIIGWQGWRSFHQWDPHETSEAELRFPESRHNFLGHAALLLSIISAIGVIYVAMPAIFIATCR